MNKKVWFITGISSGLGQAIANAAIHTGDFVVGTFRQQTQVDEFNRLGKSNALAITMDLTRPDDIERAVQVVRDRFGKIDVLVNNAGYGLAGAIEETAIQEAREIFEVNFFGTLKVCQAFLPMFRAQRTGYIVQISSHGGIKAFAGFGLYNASKFALEGMSEALKQEIQPLGIHLTIVEPGPFRTGFAGDSFKQAMTTIDDYQGTAGVFRQKIKSVDGKQEGDPEKAADVLVKLASTPNPPLRLMLGSVAVASVRSKIESVSDDLKNCEEIAKQVVFS
ncbi:oxidoreductase [Pseudochryseolinea flava]|uniref:Short-chain dehydrogenase/reductase n=1 Tax=Pseudochryseolinea flava TaxID=2059302 RepID=A0A364Y475_9BACT|nr:oxidoreductase [Pseudochryseolinea flava]RAW01539.1 short-chain dehydrogenase/reductase [Pseudochryseolinea flava]